MKLSQEEKQKEKKTLETLREYVFTEHKAMAKKENGWMPERIIHKIKRKFKLYRTFEKRAHVLFHLEESKKYFNKKYGTKSITITMIDAETLHSLQKGTKPYIEAKKKSYTYKRQLQRGRN